MPELTAFEGDLEPDEDYEGVCYADRGPGRWRF